MPLMLLASIAYADHILWTAEPDPASQAAVGRTLPGASASTLASLVDGGTPIKRDGIDILRRELNAVRPLAQEFDGELQIMSRLAKATEDVDILRGEDERNLLRRALLFEGFAVNRYFQEKLGTEAGAAPYRTMAGNGAMPTAWLEACALLASPTQIADEDIPESAQRLAYDAAQAECLAMPSATFILAELAEGAEVRIDGVKIEGGSGVRVRIVPGRHLFHVAVGDQILLAGDAQIKAGADAVIRAPFGPSELKALTALVESGKDGWAVPPAAKMPIAGFAEPTYIAVPNGEKTRLIRVDGSVASNTRLAPPEGANDVHVRGRVALGGGWLSTGDFLLQNAAAGAPEDKYTVNAGTPAANAALSVEGKLWSVGVGVDGQLTLGDYHSLPTGDTTTSVFVYPHLAAGMPWVQATVGPLFPWYLGVGGRARVPIVGPLEVFASGVYGIPLERPREDGQETFVPLPLYSAWGGVAVRFGK